MFEIAFRRAALVEFEEAVVWYEEQRAGLGEEFVREIDAVISSLAESPLRCPLVFGEVRRAVARRFPYSVYFRMRGEKVIVLAVFHARRDPRAWQSRA